MITNMRRHCTEQELNNMLNLAERRIANLQESLAIAETRQRQLELELSNARVSVKNWKHKHKILQDWIDGNMEVSIQFSNDHPNILRVQGQGVHNGNNR